MGIEIGFWDRDGDAGMRRTAVVMYGRDDGSSDRSSTSSSTTTAVSSPLEKLEDITFLQQRKVDSNGFIGNTVNNDHIKILPNEPLTGIRSIGMRIKSMKAVSCESVYIPTMTRTSRTSIKKQKELADVTARIISTMDGGGNKAKRFVQTLPNGIGLSLPREVECRGGSSSSFLIARQREDYGGLQVVEIDFEGAKAVRATLYTFKEEADGLHP